MNNEPTLPFDNMHHSNTPHSSVPVITGDSRSTFNNTLAGKTNPSNTATRITMLKEKSLFEIYRDYSYARKVIDIPVKDIFREWRTWDGTEEETRAISLYEQRLNIKQVFSDALINARLYGGCMIYMSVDGTGDPDTELDLSKVKPGALKYLQIMPRSCFSITELDENFGENQGKPLEYKLAPGKRNRNSDAEPAPTIIHPSRLVVFKGEQYPKFGQHEPISSFFGISYLHSVRNSIVGLEDAICDVKNILRESKITYILMPGLGKALQAGGQAENDVADIITSIDNSKSITNSVALDGDYKVDQKTQSLGGIRDTLTALMVDIAGKTSIPQTRLFGISSTGIGNGKDEGDLIKYYDIISGDQTAVVQPAISFLDDVLAISAIGIKGKDLQYKWVALNAPTESERVADLRMKTDLYLRMAGSPLYNPEYPRALIDKAFIDAGLDLPDFKGKKEAEAVNSDENNDETPEPTPPA